MHKTSLFSLGRYKRNNTRPGGHEFNFKKVGASRAGAIQKRFYNRETIPFIRISLLAESPSTSS